MATNLQDEKFQQHMHVFRGIAIILIVCAHTVPSLDWRQNPLLGKLIDAIANESSIFFFFIAGYLFQHLSGGFTFKKYLYQKLKTVILPYLLLSIPAILVFTILTKRIGMWSWFYDLPVWGQMGLFLLTGKHLAPLWFVPTIAIYYLFAPVFLWIDRKFPKGYWVILPLIALSTYVGRGGQLGPLNFAMYLLPFYLLGMICSRHKAAALQLVRRWWAVLLVVALIGMVGRILEWSNPPYWGTPMKLALTLLFMWLLSRHHGVIGNRLDYAAEVSFGIFFIHAYFISAFKVALVYFLTGTVYTGEGAEVIPGNALIFFAYVAAVLVASISVIWVAKKVFGKNSRMLIGA